MSEIPEDILRSEDLSKCSPSVLKAIVRFHRALEQRMRADHLKELEGLQEQLREALLWQKRAMTAQDQVIAFIKDKQDLLAELAQAEAQLRSKDEQLAGMREALENLRGAFVVLCENHRSGPVDPNFFSRYREAKVALSGPSPAQEGTE